MDKLLRISGHTIAVDISYGDFDENRFLSTELPSKYM